MTPALSSETLFAKSQTYIMRALRAKAASESEEYQLWASLAIELLGKSVLSSIHPALVADPQHFESLFAACGRPISPDIRTIIAKTLYMRLGHIEKAFDSRRQKFCEQMSLRRNSELHSGESPFSGMKPEFWEQEYWGAIEVLLSVMSQNLGTWLGAEGAKAPAEIIEQTKAARKLAVADRIRRAGEDFKVKYKDPTKQDKVKTAADEFRWWEKRGLFHAYPDDTSAIPCPSCGANGTLLGFLWEEDVVEEDFDGEQYYETVEKHFTAEEFYCPACELHLYGVDEIAAAGFPDEFVKTDERERQFEEEYNNE